jgi:predicted branched-subunit amino acid permease
VFSLHLRGYLMAWPRWQRLSIGYLVADLNYVQFVQRHPHPAPDPAGQRAEMAYLCGNSFLAWFGWQVASLAGIFLASQVPMEWGLGFAGVLALVGILCSLTQTRLRAVSLVVSGAAAVAAFAMPLRLNILVAIAAAIAVCLLVEQTAWGKKAAA